jgi:MFS family permease
MRWDRNALLLVAAYGLYGFGYIIPATFVPAMAREIVQDPAVFGWSWPLFGAAAAISTLVAAALIRVFGNRRVWLACTLVLALGVAAPAAQPGLAPILLSSVCVGATFVVITLAALQEARRTAGEGARALMVALTAAFAAGQIIGPLTVSGLVPGGLATSSDGAAMAGLQGPLWLAAALLLVSAAMLAVPVRQDAARG